MNVVPLPGSLTAEARYAGSEFVYLDFAAAQPNQPPVARDDGIHVLGGAPRIFDARANDSDADGDALTVELLGAPSHGAEAVVIVTDGLGPFPERAPAVPTLWVLTGASTAEPPFGRRARFGRAATI